MSHNPSSECSPDEGFAIPKPVESILSFCALLSTFFYLLKLPELWLPVIVLEPGLLVQIRRVFPFLLDISPVLVPI